MYAYRSIGPFTALVLTAWAQANGIPYPVPAPYMHVTVIASDTDLDDYLPDSRKVVVDPRTFRLDRFGGGDILVLRFDAPELLAANRSAHDKGAEERWPYHPHITLSYRAGRTVSPDTLPLPEFPLVLEPERSRVNDETWAVRKGLC